MKKAVILHGTMGTPEGNWFQWLKQQLEAKGLEVWVPQLPNADQPSLKEWSDYVLNNCPFVIDGDTLLVGHSSGAICSLLVAQQLISLGQVVAVSIFCNNTLGWEANNRLFDQDFDWAALKLISDKVLLISSDDDPYVTIDQPEDIARTSGAELLIWPGQGHFNLEKTQDYKAFPRLLSELEQRNII